MKRDSQIQTRPSKPPPREVEEDGEFDEPSEHAVGAFSERPGTDAGFDHDYDSEPDYAGQGAPSGDEVEYEVSDDE